MRELALTIPNREGTPAQLSAPTGIPTGGLTTVGTILSAFLNLFFLIGITLAIIFIILGGIRWITSGGDAKGVEAARKQIIYAVIGLIVVFTAFAIVQIVITFLGGDPAKFSF